MQTKSITIHNFRSIKDVTFDASKYTIFVGANNAGKSNVLTAIRVFYEDGIKYNKETDLPKFPTDDKESWIDIEYLLTQEEFSQLKDEYKRPNNTFKVRKYLQSEVREVKSNQSNIYGYVNDTPSETLFYGARNVSEAKLGSVIYIPEVTSTDDTMKLTGPSPLRNVITFVMNKVVKSSQSFASLNESFEEFNNQFKEEASRDGFSLNKLKEEINLSLEDWEVEFDLRINPIRPEDIIKNLISHYTIDKNLAEEMDVRFLGQGLQRHLIYTLINVSSKYTEQKSYGKREFSPELTLILFEEPEAFLHPSQQELLNSSLRSLSTTEGQQVFITVHSPIFVSNNIEEIPSLVRLRREAGISKAYQVSEDKKEDIFASNNELAQLLKSKLDDSPTEPERNYIKRILGNTDDDTKMEEEAIRYILWLDSERCSAFFADLVLICEGATEKTFICYLIRNKWNELQKKRICVLDAMSKFNIHRYMNLFKELGIYHSVLADEDENEIHRQVINPFIRGQSNEFTRRIDFLSPNIEAFLGVNPPPNNRNDKKPLNVLWNYSKGNITSEKIDALKDIVTNLLQ